MADKTDWVQKVRQLGTAFSARSAEHDENDSFVAENYAALKEIGFFSAGVPGELGGGDASHAELCEAIRVLAYACSSTGLAASMHTHLVATLAWVWRSGNKAPEGMLKRVASEQLVLVSTGGSDWLAGSGKLEKVDGGFRLTGRKIFGSGAPAGDVLMTTGIYDDPESGPTVIHFPLPLDANGVELLDTWRALGMRGTGSQDLQLDAVFLPDAVMNGTRRPAGKWHPFMHVVTMVALPVFYAAYLGVAEAARDRAVQLCERKRDDPHVPYLLGEMQNELVTAQLAHAGMVDVARTSKPGPATSAATLCRRSIFVKAATRTVEKAMTAAGGSSFYRSAELERLFRDVQAARFHPLPEKPQTRLVGRLMLGLDIDG